jgi:hypothetical protein
VQAAAARAPPRAGRAPCRLGGLLGTKQGTTRPGSSHGSRAPARLRRNNPSPSPQKNKTQFKGPIEDPDGKRIGSLTFCFTGTEDDPTSGYTRTRVNARGRRITDGLTVEIGYVGPPPDSELTLAQSDNFTEVGIPTVAAAPGQTAPRRTVGGAARDRSPGFVP